MSNIHGINGPRSSGHRAREEAQNEFQGRDGEIPNFMNAWYTQSLQRKNPREEGFFECLKNTFCPALRARSFITVISLVHVATFLLCSLCSMIFYSGLNTQRFLGSNQSLLAMFNKSNYELQHGQIWRLITPILLHNSLGHVIQNLLTQLIFGSMLEGMVGFKQTALIYFTSGVGGYLFSALCQDTNSVGASTAVCGLLAGLLAMIIANWKAFDRSQQLEQTRCMLVFMVALMIVMNVAFMKGPDQVDVTGHLGGSLVGLLYGLAFFPRAKGPAGERLGKYSAGFTIGFFILCSILFFTVRNTSGRI